MDAFSIALNEMLVNTYRSISSIEEAMLKDLSSGRLSISEMHMIESIGRGKEAGRSITDIAQELEITLPSVTMAIKKLEKKGFVTKERCAEDGRRVYAKLTRDGVRADVAHRFFHRQMIKTIGRNIPDDEKETLLRCLQSLNSFFKQKAEELSRSDDNFGKEGDNT